MSPRETNEADRVDFAREGEAGSERYREWTRGRIIRAADNYVPRIRDSDFFFFFPLSLPSAFSCDRFSTVNFNLQSHATDSRHRASCRKERKIDRNEPDTANFQANEKFI